MAVRQVSIRAAVVAALACVLVAAAAAPAAAQVPGNPATGQAVAGKAGCTTCHGDGGRGTAAAPAIAGTALALPAFIAKVRTPTGTMPPVSAQAVSDQDLAHVHAWLKSSTPPAAAAAAPAGRADSGATLYRKVACFTCHGNEAQGGANGPRLGPDPIPFARFLAYVRNPAGDMPPYTAKVLTDQDLADIHAFLQARTRPPAITSIPLLAR